MAISEKQKELDKIEQAFNKLWNLEPIRLIGVSNVCNLQKPQTLFN